MKEFTGHIRLELIRSSVNGTGDPQQFDLMAQPFEVDIPATEEDGGIRRTFNQQLVIDTPSDEILRTFSIPRSAIVTLFDNRHEEYRIGTDDIPARVWIDRHLQCSILRVVCAMISNPLA